VGFGESEKKIKEIFDQYRDYAENSEIAPILLFNEADAVIGKRMEFTGDSRAVDQTENAIQNIILQEIENLKGILIATTNLTENMDNAFERRFLYKIEFSNPTPSARKWTIDNVISGVSPSLDTMFSYCDAELLSKKETMGKIGFSVS
jgi:SpoVK/Ycf46/Vps4 family AAA+-type ATPase